MESGVSSKANGEKEKIRGNWYRRSHWVTVSASSKPLFKDVYEKIFLKHKLFPHRSFSPNLSRQQIFLFLDNLSRGRILKFLTFCFWLFKSTKKDRVWGWKDFHQDSENLMDWGKEGELNVLSLKPGTCSEQKATRLGGPGRKRPCGVPQNLS